MPFSSLHDPDALAQAGRVLDAAWAKLLERDLLPMGSESERVRLAHIVAGLLKSGTADNELVDAAIARFLDQREQER